MMKKLLALLLHPVLLKAAGLVALALVVWHVGPLVAIAGKTPLEPEPARWAVIGALVLAFVLREVLTRLKARASNAKLLDGLLDHRGDQAGQREQQTHHHRQQQQGGAHGARVAHDADDQREQQQDYHSCAVVMDASFYHLSAHS